MTFPQFVLDCPSLRSVYPSYKKALPCLSGKAVRIAPVAGSSIITISILNFTLVEVHHFSTLDSVLTAPSP